MGYQKYVAGIYKDIKVKINKPFHADLRALMTERKKAWRKGPAVVKVEHPTRINKARQYGFKAKQGFVVARARVRRGGARKSRPVKGRRPKRAGATRITRAKNLQRIAEERTNKRFPNLEVLGSYWLWEDGQNKWYEVVMVDPHHPVVESDKDVGWIAKKQHRGRAYRGLTPASKKGRGLRKKGKGAEKIRPSLRAKGRKAN